MNIFAELADNETSGCSAVVGVNSRKWDHLWVVRVRPGVSEGWWD